MSGFKKKISRQVTMLTDIDHFKDFFQEHLDAIYRFAYRFTGDPDVARDVAQEAFIRLHERRASFPTGEKARSFLYTTARNACLDHIKHRKIEQLYIENHSREDVGDDETFLHEVTYQETHRLLHAAIEKLSPRGRAIILHGMNGKNNAEIAGEMHLSINTVKTLKKTAYAALRELLKHVRSLLF